MELKNRFDGHINALKREIEANVNTLGFSVNEKANSWYMFEDERLTIGGMQIQQDGIRYHIDVKKGSNTSKIFSSVRGLTKHKGGIHHDTYVVRIERPVDVLFAFIYVNMLLNAPMDVRVKSARTH